MSAKTLDAYDEQEAIEIAKHHVSNFYLSIERKDLSIKDFSLVYNRLEMILCFCLKKG